MIKIQDQLKPADLQAKLERFWKLSGIKLREIERTSDASKGSPVLTIRGVYTSRGWTEWTQGFQYGSSLLQFDATGEEEFLELGRQKTLKTMAPHLNPHGSSRSRI